MTTGSKLKSQRLMESLDPWNYTQRHSVLHTDNKNIPAEHLLGHLRGWWWSLRIAPCKKWLWIKEHPMHSLWGWNIWWMMDVINFISHEKQHKFTPAYRLKLTRMQWRLFPATSAAGAGRRAHVCPLLYVMKVLTWLSSSLLARYMPFIPST